MSRAEPAHQDHLAKTLRPAAVERQRIALTGRHSVVCEIIAIKCCSRDINRLPNSAGKSSIGLGQRRM